VRIAFFGTAGIITRLPLEALASEHEIVLFVRPGARPSMLSRARSRLRRDPLETFVRRSRVPVAWMRDAGDPSIASKLQRLAPDLLCISTFRWVLPEAVLRTARYGAINLHSSLLPRHRGAVPLFWIFYRDDRETGVTVHRASASADAGEILARDSWPLPRGTTADQLNAMNAERGAALLARVTREIERGESHAVPQDESLVTPAPAVPRSGKMIAFDEWPAERVWHFLHAVYPYYVEDLGVRYRDVLGWEPANGGRAGEITRNGNEVVVHCIDGVVRLRYEAAS